MKRKIVMKNEISVFLHFKFFFPIPFNEAILNKSLSDFFYLSYFKLYLKSPPINHTIKKLPSLPHSSLPGIKIKLFKSLFTQWKKNKLLIYDFYLTEMLIRE